MAVEIQLDEVRDGTQFNLVLDCTDVTGTTLTANVIRLYTGDNCGSLTIDTSTGAVSGSINLIDLLYVLPVKQAFVQGDLVEDQSGNLKMVWSMTEDDVVAFCGTNSYSGISSDSVRKVGSVDPNTLNVRVY